jgi:hypothetical protein
MLRSFVQCTTWTSPVNHSLKNSNIKGFPLPLLIIHYNPTVCHLTIQKPGPLNNFKFAMFAYVKGMQKFPLKIFYMEGGYVM